MLLVVIELIEVPVKTSEPPVGALYHRIVLPFAPTVGVILPEPQTTKLVAVGGFGMGFTVIVTGNRAAVLSQDVEEL